MWQEQHITTLHGAAWGSPASKAQVEPTLHSHHKPAWPSDTHYTHPVTKASGMVMWARPCAPQGPILIQVFIQRPEWHGHRELPSQGHWHSQVGGLTGWRGIDTTRAAWQTVL